MTRYKSTPLYGGALVADLPEKFADVRWRPTPNSKLREVPDNQEVWIDSDGFTSIIFDITERVGPAGSSPEIDGRAMTTHLEELVGEDIDTVKVWNTTETSFSRLSPDVPAYTLIATQTPRAKKSGSSAPDFTAIILTLLRLEKESTDILVTINVPHIKGEYDEADVDLELGKQGKLIGDAVEYAARIWETFKVKDWTLFQEV
ncbi:putative Ras-related protein Rab7 [Colletotrichum spaethianum]|uniref:Ras-related protein Rab7 n=1 Tax=Colletotrichum spaethianum TaxID=700344 RepID=A0AA37P6K6_9PEZI|nr:putative Ras-related protein Rab7 [Colletotrichum spaethianum]GKT39904.1 putative Ras-related protein Rab7 [Colletotrichum spaethianum]